MVYHRRTSTTSVRYEYNGTEHGLQKYHELV